MNTQTKPFTVNLLQSLIEEGHFENTTSGNIDQNVIERYNNNIPQETIYAIEESNGKVVVLQNDIINSLVSEKINYDHDIKRARQIGHSNINICILFSDDEVLQLRFKTLTGKSAI
jgi:hypothetical protein